VYLLQMISKPQNNRYRIDDEWMLCNSWKLRNVIACRNGTQVVHMCSAHTRISKKNQSMMLYMNTKFVSKRSVLAALNRLAEGNDSSRGGEETAFIASKPLRRQIQGVAIFKFGLLINRQTKRLLFHECVLTLTIHSKLRDCPWSC
jgi:hypothetical protein